jgi:hypothetical protein
MNKKLAEGNAADAAQVFDSSGPVDGYALSLANEISEDSQNRQRNGWHHNSPQAARRPKIKEQDVSDASMTDLPQGPPVPYSRSQQTFGQQNFINHAPEENVPAMRFDSSKLGPYTSQLPAKFLQVPGSRSQQTFGQQPFVTHAPEEDVQATKFDSSKLQEPPAKSLSMVKTRTSYFIRPQAAAGTADIIYFGIYGKTFFGTDLKHQEFTIDYVLTLEWTDARVESLIPAGQYSMTMSGTEAKSKMWLPDIWVTNKVAHKSDVISVNLNVFSNGTVNMVERSFAVVKNRFQLEEYPFDEQTLLLSIASEKYMLSELILSPLDDPEASGLREGFFDNAPYQQTDFTVKADDDVDGLLQKSHGYMEIVIQRTPSRYQHRYLFPAILYSAIACAVFWLPYTPAFVVPRLALSIIILLVFSNFTIVVDAELPDGAPYNWIDLICIIVRLHMFSVICLNIFTEVAFWTMGCTVIAKQMNNEMKLLSPLAVSVAFVLVFIGSQTKGTILNLTGLTILLPILFSLYITIYATCCAASLSTAVEENRRAELKQDKGPYAGESGGSSESLTPNPRYYDS